MNKLRGLLKSKMRLPLLLLIDYFCFAFAYWLIMSRLLRAYPDLSVNYAWIVHAVMLLCIVLGRVFMQINRQVWRYAEAGVYLRMVLAGFCAGMFYLLIDRLFLPRHIPFASIVAIFTTGFLASLAARFAYQVLRRKPLFQRSLAHAPALAQSNKIKVAIVGAGEMGVLLARELVANRNARYAPYCFFDNDVRKIGTQIEGLPVYGPDNVVVGRVNSMPIQEIIIALPNVSGETQKKVFDTYKHTNCRVMLYDYSLANRSAGEEKRSIREINIEDLLFRDVVSLDDERLHGAYEEKTVLVTGAGGSIGSELCRQVAKLRPKLLVMLDINENGVYDIQQELKRHYGDRLRTRALIANICDARRMEAVFSEYKPDMVFHAAAHKHVPLMESNCAEAVVNNVFGTCNVVRAAEQAKVKRFVMISTDKAVNPTNVMGATKRMCEMIIQSRKDSATDFIAVRFGNVLGSNGSVVPLFKKQIAEGGPVTITDRRIIRYFMAIPEAAQLVLRTGSQAAKGEIYVLDMGRPVRILDLAESMIALSGFTPYDEIDIKEIGLRPGEKLYEELLIKTENCIKTKDERIFIERDEALGRAQIDQMLSALQTGLELNDSDASVRELMMELVPSYRQPEIVNLDAVNAKEFTDAAAAAALPDSLLIPGIPS